MWSHYSANHTGFVIEFDEKHSFFDQRKKPTEIRRHVKKVRYSNERPSLTIFSPNLSNNEQINKWTKDFFWVKSSNWAYEKEWRMIYTLRNCQHVISNTDPPICLFPLPLDCIKTIIFGCRALPEDKKKIIDLLRSNQIYSHIGVQETVIDPQEYKLSIEKFTFN
jgi:hypothetical protein